MSLTSLASVTSLTTVVLVIVIKRSLLLLRSRLMPLACRLGMIMDNDLPRRAASEGQLLLLAISRSVVAIRYNSLYSSA